MKIGMIAMSGVRAQNKELTKLGLTLPGFVERNKIIASMPSLSLLTLAALTPPRHKVEYMEIADLNAAGELPDDFDLVAITSFTAQIKDAYRVAAHYRSKNIPVVMGGLHVSSLPREAQSLGITAAIGEGEELWPAIVADAEKESLKPVYAQTRPGSFNLAHAPVPRYDLLDPRKYNRLTVQTSRGCPHRCHFCASSILLTNRYKTKPVSRVLEEIAAIKNVWDRPFIEFADDNSFADRQHYKNLLRALKREKLRWFTETDIRVAEDDELLGLMRASGCQQVLIGLESPRRKSLNGVELKSNWKMRQQEHYLKSIARIQSKGITVNGCFILGLDEDTPAVFQDVLDFVRASHLYEVQVTFLTPFPGTPLYRQLKHEERLLQDKAWEACTLFDINFIPRNMTVQQLHDGFLGLVKTLYSQEETEMRRHRFKEQLRSANRGRAGVSSLA